MGKLDSRIAIVTGAAGGLGKAIALLFAREGADIAILDRKAEGAEAVARQMRDLGRRGLAVVADVSDETQVGAAMARIFGELGEPDILVNNAGIDTTSTVEEMPTEMWDEMIRINLRSVFLCTRAVLPAMRRKGYGRIVNISSQLAHKGGAQMAHYAAAKAGILGFTRSLSYEVAKDNITVNAICPGPVAGELWMDPGGLLDQSMELSGAESREQALAAAGSKRPIGRLAEIEEIASAIVFLCSERASYVAGAAWSVDGGTVQVII